MDRRSFLASTFASALGPFLPPSKELVLNYTTTDNDLHRGVVVTGQLAPCLGVCDDHLDPNRKVVLDAKRAWVLPDGRMEVERYQLYDDPGHPFGLNSVKGLDGDFAMQTTILTEWTFRKVDHMGRTLYERHSERT